MHHDAIIVGGSYAGLSAAIQLGRAGRKVCIVDTGLPRNRFAAASHGFFGHDGQTPGEMLDRARAQVLAYPTVSFVQDEAIAADGQDGQFTVRLASGVQRSASKLLLAFGVSDELPPIDGMAERWGQSVLHCPYCHGYEYGGNALGVIGRSAHAAQHAVLIAEWGPTTLFLDGHDALDADGRALLAARGVAVEPAPIRALQGDAPSLSGVALADGRTVAIEALYLAPVTRLNSPIAAQLGCELEDSMFGPIITTDAMKMTTVPGVFAAGDAARAPHNATWASADGVMAGTALHRALVFGTA